MQNYCTVGPWKRKEQFPGHPLSVRNNDLRIEFLSCDVCGCTVSHTTKSTVQGHLKCKKHAMAIETMTNRRRLKRAMVVSRSTCVLTNLGGWVEAYTITSIPHFPAACLAALFRIPPRIFHIFSNSGDRIPPPPWLPSATHTLAIRSFTVIAPWSAQSLPLPNVVRSHRLPPP